MKRGKIKSKKNGTTPGTLQEIDPNPNPTEIQYEDPDFPVEVNDEVIYDERALNLRKVPKEQPAGN